jgi:hypothetical protein
VWWGNFHFDGEYLMLIADYDVVPSLFLLTKSLVDVHSLLG